MHINVPYLNFRVCDAALYKSLFKLDEINKALDLFRSGKAGRIVVKMYV